MAIQRQPSQEVQEKPSILRPTDRLDVVIIGGGPAGLSAAISLLQRSSLSIAIIDSQRLEFPRIGESLPPDTILLLRKLGVADAFYRAGHQTCPGYSSVWGSDDVGHNDFIVNPMGPAWCMDRMKFDAMLVEEAQRLGAQIHWETRFLSAAKSSEGYSIRLRQAETHQESTLQARFVIDASGAKARFAHALGIEKEIHDQLFALIRLSRLDGGKPTRRVQIEAVPQGWWYHTALPNDRVITMFVTQREQLQTLRADDFAEFEQRLERTSFIHPQIRTWSLSEYLIRPIYSGILPAVEGKDWVAIGDAASSYDPVVSHGIYKGMSDGIHIAPKVIASLVGGDHSAETAYSSFVRKRYHQYLQNRAFLYARERRFPNQPFWQNRLIGLERIAVQLGT
ncbi:NAD(P)/FAD-dependent oxidoreductase [Pontibacter sp. G13]|uniref:NAD(P)/FAD-dependent oxidoreductase n=1 Tax=Pontibacter sp. G13 TaxID=3074898 RepID=UPI00288907B5|nr:NAD(P)/FAD-dependent oxidoreductase [Pontibacter sp. G13]WNJ17561.1 NAD(P)/FAD-dependent oxidoreductase [Pontibacter sp. G13]